MPWSDFTLKETTPGGHPRQSNTAAEHSFVHRDARCLCVLRLCQDPTVFLFYSQLSASQAPTPISILNTAWAKELLVIQYLLTIKDELPCNKSNQKDWLSHLKFRISKLDLETETQRMAIAKY